MSAKHMIFLPWGNGGGFTRVDDWDNYSQGGELNHSYNYEKVLYNDGTSLRGLPAGSEIYVYGHCGAGQHYYEADDGGPDLTYSEVADRILSHGLQKSFVGAIKLYACQSGLCSMGSQSFAAKFAQYMRFSKGYHLISYVGYYGLMDQRPIDTGGKHKHKTAEIHTPFGKVDVKSKWAKAFF